jgi:hypothetical protein
MNAQNVIAHVIAQCAKLSSVGARFVSLTYTNANKEEARHLILLGVDYNRITRATLASVLLKTVSNPVEAQAKAEVVASLRETLAAQAEGRAHSADTNADTYVSIPGVRGVKIHKETGQVYVAGAGVSKTVITPGVYPVVKSSAKTLAKNALLRGTPRAKWRQFIIAPENAESIRIGGLELRAN